MNPPTPHGIAPKPVRRRRPSLAVVALIGVAAGTGLQLATRVAGAPGRPASAAVGSAHPGISTAHDGAAREGSPAAGGIGVDPTGVDAALAALGPQPSMHDVLDSEGLEQMVLVGRFATSASSEQLRSLADTLDDSKKLTIPLADAIFLRWTTIDPAGAAAWAEGKWWINSVVWSMAKTDPEAALAYGLEHDCAVNAIRSVAQDDPARGEALLAAHPDLAVRGVWEGIASGLARTDSRAAAIYAFEHEVGTEDYFKRWAKEDSEEALRFANELKSPRQRREALAETLAIVAEADVNEAFARAESLPPGGMRADIVAGLMAGFSRTDPSAAAAQALALTSPFERDLALGMVGSVLATSDPDLALELLGQISSEGMGRHSGSVRFSYPNGGGSTSSSAWGTGGGSALERAFGTLAASHPERTFGLLADLPASDEVNEFAQAEAHRWVERAPEEASTWLATLPPGARRDSMVSGLTSALTDGAAPDYESALAWALTLEPGSHLHRRTLENLFSKWTSHDAAAAMAAMEREAAQ